jgi:signal transduction histidine kinase
MTGVALRPGAGPPVQDADVEIRGLLHDLGHQMMTLSLLAETVRDDSTLSGSSRQRMELVMQEMIRIVDVIKDSMPHGPAEVVCAAPSVIDVRRLAGEVSQLAQLAYDTSVVLCPGSPAVLRIGPTLLWRVLANLVDNAVRAAGPHGTVEIRVEQKLDTVIEVIDSGAGFGSAPCGVAGIGLTVVEQLLQVEGGTLDMATAESGGTCARVSFSLDREYRRAPLDTGAWH